MRNWNRKKKGHRFTVDDKLISTCIHSKGSSAYTYLLGFMALPAEKTLRRMKDRLRFAPGVDTAAMTRISKKADCVPDEEKDIFVM